MSRELITDPQVIEDIIANYASKEWADWRWHERHKTTASTRDDLIGVQERWCRRSWSKRWHSVHRNSIHTRYVCLSCLCTKEEDH